MVFVLTTEGYINILNPALKLHKFKAISGCDEHNPHISIDLEQENSCFEITFLNSMDVIMSDRIELLDEQGDYQEIDKLKFGVKLVFVRTPDNIVEKLLKRPEYIEIINDLAALIISKGRLRKVDYDATHCDMVVEWNKKKVQEFVFSLSSVGIYLKVKATNTKSKFVMTADSNTLNFLDNNRNILDECKVEKMKEMKAIDICNIDKERDADNYKIVKSVQSLENIEGKVQLFLKTKSHIDSWKYITICGLQCKAKESLLEIEDK